MTFIRLVIVGYVYVFDFAAYGLDEMYLVLKEKMVCVESDSDIFVWACYPQDLIGSPSKASSRKILYAENRTDGVCHGSYDTH
jgi:hypothetical protein